jgi:hypothetical protein
MEPNEEQQSLDSSSTSLKDTMMNLKLEQQSTSTIVYPKIISLNVGGRHLDTTLDTLCRDKSSMLAAMFSGRLPSAMDSGGRYFIDRNGDLFVHVLDWLRMGRLTLPDGGGSNDNNEALLRALLVDAEFYQLQSLVDELQSRLTAGRHTTNTGSLAATLYHATTSHWADYASRAYHRFMPVIINKFKEEINENLWGHYRCKIRFVQAVKVAAQVVVAAISTPSTSTESGYYEVEAHLR